MKNTIYFVLMLKFETLLRFQTLKHIFYKKQFPK